MINKDEWIKVEDRLPDHNTRYAGEYGVTILVFDMEEHEEVGYRPHEGMFDFKDNKLKIEVDDYEGGDWIEAPFITHWKELPVEPKE